MIVLRLRRMFSICGARFHGRNWVSSGSWFSPGVGEARCRDSPARHCLVRAVLNSGFPVRTQIHAATLHGCSEPILTDAAIRPNGRRDSENGRSLTAVRPSFNRLCEMRVGPAGILFAIAWIQPHHLTEYIPSTTDPFLDGARGPSREPATDVGQSPGRRSP